MNTDSGAQSGDSGSAGRGPAVPSPSTPVRPALVFDDPLDQRSADDTDDGWGERPAAGAATAADLARFLDEKPPHHI